MLKEVHRLSQQNWRLGDCLQSAVRLMRNWGRQSGPVIESKQTHSSNQAAIALFFLPHLISNCNGGPLESCREQAKYVSLILN